MHVLTHEHHEPAFNLACEEYFLGKPDVELFMLWRNRPSVIIGRNQNVYNEIEPAFVAAHDITVMRRMTGGGAVYHDLGNINYSHIAPHGGPIDFARFCEPMVRLLQGIGLDAQMTGRNDILIGGKKVSGTAQTIRRGRALHHGTLLYNVKLERLAGALRAGGDKYAGSAAVKSVASRVANIASLLPDPPVTEAFQKRLMACFLDSHPYCVPYELTQEDLDGIAEIRREKYDRPDWTYRKNEQYDFKSSVRCPSGGLTVNARLEDSVIRAISFTGDFFGNGEVCELEEKLAGTAYTPEALRDLLDDGTIERYFAGFAWEDVKKALF